MPADRPVVAAFDFDGTLTRGGSVWRFLAAVGRRRRLAVATVVLLPRLVVAALLGGAWADAGKEALFARVLAGCDAAEAAEAAAHFGLAHYRRRARADVRRHLDAHRRAGHKVVVVSASPELYLRPLAAALGWDGVVATRLAVGPDGRLTGRYDGLNCRGPEKIGRLRHWVAEAAGVDDEAVRPLLWAYGNSAGDRQLLQAADVAVNVGRLGRLGRLRAFPPLRRVPAPGPG